MPGTIKQSDMIKGLTPKQTEFARCVASGMTLSDSYKASYNAENMKDATVHSKACILMTDGKISARVESINRAKDRAIIALSVSDKDRVLTKLRFIADNAEGTAAENTALRACDLLGKTVGLYKDVIETVTQRTPGEVQAELADLLAEYKEAGDQSIH